MVGCNMLIRDPDAVGVVRGSCRKKIQQVCRVDDNWDFMRHANDILGRILPSFISYGRTKKQKQLQRLRYFHE